MTKSDKRVIEETKIELLKNHIIGISGYEDDDELVDFEFVTLHRSGLIASIYNDCMCPSTVVYEVSDDGKIKLVNEID